MVKEPKRTSFAQEPYFAARCHPAQGGFSLYLGLGLNSNRAYTVLEYYIGLCIPTS